MSNGAGSIRQHNPSPVKKTTTKTTTSTNSTTADIKMMSKTTSNATSNAHYALLALLIESTGIVIVTVVAGISDQVANFILLFVVGLWILFLVMNADIVSKFSDKLTNIESGAVTVKTRLI